MRHSRETLKIVVAETSLILRTGIVAAIRRAIDSGVQSIEISEPSEILTKIRSYEPDILIINPLFSPGMKVSELRGTKGISETQMRIVAIIAGAIDKRLLDEYDGIVNLYDTPEQIHQMLDNVMGYDEPEIESADADEQLSQREKEIIREVVKGYTNKEIAGHLNLSVFTVLTHRRNIAKKLQIHSSTALTLYAISNNIISITEVK